MAYKTVILEIIRFLLILLFFYTAASKLLDYERFIVQLGQSPLLAPFAREFAWFVPAVEIGICVLLITRQHQLAGFVASFGIMVLFTAYITAILNFSETIPCSCGGVLGTLGWKEHLVFNGVFVGLTLWGVILKCQSVIEVGSSSD